MKPRRTLVTTSTIALLLALAGCSSDGPDARSAPTPHPEGPTSSSPEVPTDLDGVVGPLEAGPYSLRVWGDTRHADLPRAILEVPEGWYSDGGLVIDSGNSNGEPEQVGQISVWLVDRIYRNPCRPRTATDAGANHSYVTLGLMRQEGTSTTARRVALNGHLGTRMQVQVPRHAHQANCTGGRYALWRAADGAVHSIDRAGSVHHLWILDVGDLPLVVVVTANPDQPNGQPEDLLAVARTIRFVPAR